MDLLRRIRVQALQPQKIDALIDLVDHDLGYRLYQSVERTKCVLSDDTQTEFRFDEGAVAIEKPISRPQFEGWIDLQVSLISRCVDRLLTTCSVAPQDVDAVFMTGGSSFVPAIRKLFAQDVWRGNTGPRRRGIYIGRRRLGDPRIGAFELSIDALKIVCLGKTND